MNIAKIRKRYRDDVIPAGYDGVANVLLNLAVCLGLMVGSLLLMGRPTWSALGWMALTSLLFNAIEYGFHRWLSHNKAFRRIHRRHVTEHHGFFDSQRMTSEHLADLHVTILPTRTIAEYYLLFLALLLAPLGWLAGLASAAAASFAVAFNILLLDVLHYYYHLEPDNVLSRWLDRSAYCRRLKENHRVHHAHTLMRKCNFNITHPWCDALLGTRYKE
jgi:hypothetical protein